MTWYQKYIDDPEYHQRYRASFHGVAHWFDDPEDACATALEQLFYVKLPKRTSEPPNNPDGFVMTSFQNVLVDLSRAENGRLRAPREIKRRGPLHEAIFFQVRENFKPLSVIIEESPLPAVSVIETVEWIKANAWMPLRPLRAELENNDTGELRTDIEQHANTATDPVLENVEAEQQLAMLNLILQPAGGENCAQSADVVVGDAASRVINSIRAELALDTLDRALLNEFKHGAPTVKEICQMLGSSRSEVQRRKIQLIPRIEKILGKHGFFAPTDTDSGSTGHDPVAPAPEPSGR